jgi:hypothetical protein
MSETNWFILKAPSQQCQIVSAQSLDPLDLDALDLDALDPDTLEPPPTERWGPFKTQNQAIAKRVGLIRAGKCKPS